MVENNCDICKEDYIGYGNNANPVIDGKCCDICNVTIVIPTRLGCVLEQKQNLKYNF
tara:strand:+ start:669 stop:839 length:171 start_codon:yes stop_codon:yes gene_type:complete